MPVDTTVVEVADGALGLAAFTCPPSDHAWQHANVCGAAHVLAFAHVPVGIRMVGSVPRVADANRVMLYDPRTRYERHLLDPAGDRCTYVRVAPRLLAMLSSRLIGGGTRPRFRTDQVPVAADVVMRLRVLATRLRAGTVDPLVAEEELLAIVLAVLAVERPSDLATAASTRRSHQRLVEQARAWIAAHATESWTLEGLADELHTAAAHLHRVFRSRTGTTIHEHRDRLRLARALDMVLDGAHDLAAVGTAVGYSSHSHFTRRFRHTYGVTPSAVRAGAARTTEPATTTSSSRIAP